MDPSYKKSSRSQNENKTYVQFCCFIKFYATLQITTFVHFPLFDFVMQSTHPYSAHGSHNFHSAGGARDVQCTDKLKQTKLTMNECARQKINDLDARWRERVRRRRFKIGWMQIKMIDIVGSTLCLLAMQINAIWVAKITGNRTNDTLNI